MFNELTLVLLIYTFTGLFSVEGTPVMNTLESQWMLGYITIGLIGAIYIVNFGFMIMIICCKIPRGIG